MIYLQEEATTSIGSRPLGLDPAFGERPVSHLYHVYMYAKNNDTKTGNIYLYGSSQTNPNRVSQIFCSYPNNTYAANSFQDMGCTRSANLSPGSSMLLSQSFGFSNSDVLSKYRDQIFASGVRAQYDSTNEYVDMYTLKENNINSNGDLSYYSSALIDYSLVICDENEMSFPIIPTQQITSQQSNIPAFTPVPITTSNFTSPGLYKLNVSINYAQVSNSRMRGMISSQSNAFSLRLIKRNEPGINDTIVESSTGQSFFDCLRYDTALSTLTMEVIFNIGDTRVDGLCINGSIDHRQIEMAKMPLDWANDSKLFLVNSVVMTISSMKTRLVKLI